MKTRTFADRQSEKTIVGLLSTHLLKNYRLPPKAAETLCNDTVLLQSLFGNKSRAEGQIIYYATKIGESPGKPLKDCQMVPVVLSLMSPKDIEVRKRKGVRGLNIEIMKRITREAHAQGALLTLEDICNILHIGVATAKRYKKIIEGGREFLPLRGTYTDIGPGVSHKERIISLFLLGYPQTKIAEQTHHNLTSVERYLHDFIRVITMLDAHYKEGAIIRITRLSKKTVLSYTSLYKKYSRDPLYEEPLKRVIELYKLRREFAKKKGSR